MARAFASMISGAATGSAEDNCNVSASAAKCAAVRPRARHTIRNTNNNRNPNRFLRQVSQASAATGEVIIMFYLSQWERAGVRGKSEPAVGTALASRGR